MNLTDLLANPAVLQGLAQSAGIGTGEARSGLEALLPAVTRGLARNASGSSGLEGLIGALGSGAHNRYIDEPEALAKPDTRADGNAILGHIFGSKDVSRNVAAHASQGSGLDSALLRKMLPIVASLAMGALSKGSGGGQSLQPSSNQGGGGLLGSLLTGLVTGGTSGGGSRNDSPMDDILDLAKKFL